MKIETPFAATTEKPSGAERVEAAAVLVVGRKNVASAPTPSSNTPRPNKIAVVFLSKPFVFVFFVLVGSVAAGCG